MCVCVCVCVCMYVREAAVIGLLTERSPVQYPAVAVVILSKELYSSPPSCINGDLAIAEEAVHVSLNS